MGSVARGTLQGILFKVRVTKASPALSSVMEFVWTMAGAHPSQPY